MNRGTYRITYEFAAFFENAYDGLLARRDVPFNLPETRHKIK